MTTMAPFLLRLSGYPISLLDQYEANAADRRVLQLIGGGVFFTCIWFPAMAMIAAWALSGQAIIEIRISAVAFAGTIALLFVLAFDRGFLFASDTSTAGSLKLACSAFARISIVLAIASLVDVAIMPVVMGPELALDATTLRAEVERNRSMDLDRRYGIAARLADVQATRDERDSARASVNALPKNIVADLTRADRCFAALPRPGVAAHQAYERLRHRCIALRGTGQSERADYLRLAKARLAEAARELVQSRSDYRNAQNQMTAHLDSAAAEDAQTYVASNFAVFIHLLSTQTSALLKALGLLVVHLSFDLVPFILKAFFGRTGVGARVRADRRREILCANADVDAATDDYEVRVESSHAAAMAARSALARPAMRSFLEDLAEDEARIVEPLEQAAAAFRRAVAAERDMSRIHTGTRQLRRLKMELWSRAVANSLNAAVPAR